MWGFAALRRFENLHFIQINSTVESEVDSFIYHENQPAGMIILRHEIALRATTICGFELWLKFNSNAQEQATHNRCIPHPNDHPPNGHESLLLQTIENR